MKVTGIIAEYNPFHNGHLYQLQKAKQDTHADYTVIVMSGNFVQRGTPAIIDKYTRTRMALCNGADLVLELPVLWSTASAEYFASAGITLLDRLGVTDTVSFGVESGHFELLAEIATVLAEEPESYRSALNQELRQGTAFPAARKRALLITGLLPSANPLSILDTPNNILAIEYLKALKKRNSSIQPIPIQRKGSDYHDTDIHTLASASAIRSCMQQNSVHPSLKTSMPDNAFQILNDYTQKLPLIDENIFSSILKYKLLSDAATGFSDYADCSPNLSNRIVNCLKEYVSFSDFCDLLKSKEVTHTRISRMLLHILLNIRQEDYMAGRTADYIPYLRVLGFRKNASPLLSSIKKHTSIPLITKVADAKEVLLSAYPEHSFAWEMFSKDIFASDIYTSMLTTLAKTPVPNEYTHGLVMI